jgi:hypothetical protein
MQDAQQRSREDFVEQFRAKYDGRLPTRVVTEILDFDTARSKVECMKLAVPLPSKP